MCVQIQAVNNYYTNMMSIKIIIMKYIKMYKNLFTLAMQYMNSTVNRWVFTKRFCQGF